MEKKLCIFKALSVLPAPSLRLLDLDFFFFPDMGPLPFSNLDVIYNYVCRILLMDIMKSSIKDFQVGSGGDFTSPRCLSLFDKGI